MVKNLKLNITNAQLAKAAGLDTLKIKRSKKEPKEETPPPEEIKEVQEGGEAAPEAKPRIRARAKSAFAKEEAPLPEEAPVAAAPEVESAPLLEKEPEQPVPPPLPEKPSPEPVKAEEKAPRVVSEKLGPTGRHIKDLLPPKPAAAPTPTASPPPAAKEKVEGKPPESEEDALSKKLGAKKGKKVRDFQDVKPAKKAQVKGFDARDRQGLTEGEEDRWRKKRAIKPRMREEQEIQRPTKLSIRLPITVKDLAIEMKLKSSELIQKFFLNGITYTLNDFLDDAMAVQYIASEFGCDITIDTREEERIQITSQSVREEISATEATKLVPRPPVVAFMGHVNHGKTSLIDAICKSDLVSGEAGGITQHIGAFRCKTPVGDLTILDTPGHEAFSAMRARGAEVTDIVVLVVAGDEGIRTQSLEAIQHVKAAGVTIMVAINKCDKPNFSAENVYRELAEADLLPEVWGGSTVTVNTSATTGKNIPELLEMLALQAEVLELKADPSARARGTVIESELHKGRGNVATLLVQNGTLRQGDAVVFERHWGRVKTLHDEHGRLLLEAPPSTPVEITGLSGLPSAGDPFIVVKSEKEAKHIVESREVGREQRALQQRKLPSLDQMMQAGDGARKILKLILRADVQGSAEALRTSILKITSKKVTVEVISLGVGEISESDVQLAAASRATIIGFHTAIEQHAEPLIKEAGVTVRLFDIIYHAVDAVKELMFGLLDKIEEEKETGVAEVKATFKSSQLGIIAGSLISEGVINRNHRARLVRGGNVLWKGSISSIRREKEDVKEVKKGFECGIVLAGWEDICVGDLIQGYEIVYKTQEL